MQGVILAGGLAKRLRPASLTVPKSLIPINGKPFLLYILNQLKEQGIIDVVLCIGNLGERIRDQIGTGQSLGMRISFSQETGRLLGTGGALKLAESVLEERFFVLNGDTYLPIDYGQVEKQFVNSGKDGLIVVYDNRVDTGVANNIEIDESTLDLVRYDKEHPSGLKYVEAGLMALKRDVLKYIVPGRFVGLEEGLFPSLITKRKLAAYKSYQRFWDIGTPQRVTLFETFIGDGQTS